MNGRVLSCFDSWGQDFILENPVLRRDNLAVVLTYAEIETVSIETLREVLNVYPNEARLVGRARARLALIRGLPRLARILRAIEADDAPDDAREAGLMVLEQLGGGDVEREQSLLNRVQLLPKESFQFTKKDLPKSIKKDQDSYTEDGVVLISPSADETPKGKNETGPPHTALRHGLRGHYISSHSRRRSSSTPLSRSSPEKSSSPRRQSTRYVTAAAMQTQLDEIRDSINDLKRSEYLDAKLQDMKKNVHVELEEIKQAISIVLRAQAKLLKALSTSSTDEVDSAFKSTDEANKAQQEQVEENYMLSKDRTKDGSNQQKLTIMNQGKWKASTTRHPKIAKPSTTKQTSRQVSVDLFELRSSKKQYANYSTSPGSEPTPEQVADMASWASRSSPVLSGSRWRESNAQRTQKSQKSSSSLESLANAARGLGLALGPKMEEAYPSR